MNAFLPAAVLPVTFVASRPHGDLPGGAIDLQLQLRQPAVLAIAAAPNCISIHKILTTR